MVFFGGALGIRHAIEYLLLLIARGTGKLFLELSVGLAIEPHQAAEDLRLQILIAVLRRPERDPTVQKFRHPSLGRAAAALIGGDDQIAQHTHRAPLMIVEGLAL